MKFSKFFKGAFLTADQLDGKPLRVTIASIEPEEIGGEEKLVVSFEEIDKKLPLNKVNACALSKAFGDQVQQSVGKVILLKLDETDLHGKRVPCVRIGLPLKKTPPAVEAGEDDGNDNLDV